MRTYRPGMLTVGSYTGRPSSPKVLTAPPKPKHYGRKILIVLVVAIGVVMALYIKNNPKSFSYQSATIKQIASVSKRPIKPTECINNTSPKLIVVVLDRQHLWACDYNQVVFSSAVVTGYLGNPADVTPTGSYKIFTKETNVTLRGTDGVTTWDDPVHYWMPFLFNKYGAYGFHDATWRTPQQFGHISTNSPNASHGCVECPLATATWLFNWASVGTSVSIKQA